MGVTQRNDASCLPAYVVRTGVRRSYRAVHGGGSKQGRAVALQLQRSGSKTCGAVY